MTNESANSLIGRLLASVLGEEAPPHVEGSDLLIQDLGVDSVGFVALLAELEELLGVSIPDEDFSLEKFATVGDLKRFIVRVDGKVSG